MKQRKKKKVRSQARPGSGSKPGVAKPRTVGKSTDLRGPNKPADGPHDSPGSRRTGSWAGWVAVVVVLVSVFALVLVKWNPFRSEEPAGAAGFDAASGRDSGLAVDPEPPSAADAGAIQNEAGSAPDRSLRSDARFIPEASATEAAVAANASMVRRLAEIAETSDSKENAYLSDRRAAEIRAALNANPDRPPQEALKLRMNLAMESLKAGETLEAIAELEALEKQLSELGLKLASTTRRSRTLLKTFLGVSYLRLGEQENCLANHTTDSCLLPIREGGVHQFPRGSRGAIRHLSEALEAVPEDLMARWLLNIAYMTLGEYPGAVPEPWLISPDVFASEHDVGRFPDVAAGTGLNVHGLAGGAVVEDFDGDGFLDVMTSSMALTGPLRYFRSAGNGEFLELTEPAGLRGLNGGLNMVHADYNNDGRPDVLVLRGGWYMKAGYHPNSLLRNNPDGTFTDVTEEAGLLSLHPTQTAVWFDYNNDGWIDLFVGNESYAGDRHPCELFRNNGDGTFTDIAGSASVQLVGFFKGVAAGDYNNDGLPDLYLSRQGESNILLRNDGPDSLNPEGWRFTDVTRAAGVEEPVRSFPTWFFDYNGDGWLDLFVAGYSIRDVGDIAADYLGLPNTGETPRLYRNTGGGTFVDVTRSVGLNRVLRAMGANFGDLDNDGWLDFYIGTGDPELSTLAPNRMFRNQEGVRFQDVTSSGGFGHLQKGHGVSFADIDNDGDQDVYHNVGGAYSGDGYWNVLFQNPGHRHRWIKLKLEGERSNRAGVGARIRIRFETESGVRQLHDSVSTGGSFGGSPLRREIGLGAATRILELEVFWPASGRRQVFDDVATDRFYLVRESANELRELPLKSFVIGDGSSGHEGHSGRAHHH